MTTTLKYNNVKVVHSRAEDAGHDTAHREAYDLVPARSVAHMPILMETTAAGEIGWTLHRHEG
ncbi:MAG: hypothetical protein U0528_09920 [Anaerolineae bacterium]